ncbi:MAG: sel1 repeat family protein [Idiomarina sp.]|nr:sel1 repeat family protein [Idiomarina sp.]
MKLSMIVSSLLVAFALTGVAAPVSVAQASQADRVCQDNDCTATINRMIRLARNGSGDAAAIVAMAYASGEGVEQDLNQAARYARYGVRHRSAVAAYMLSDWHSRGFVVEQDEVEANRLLDIAVNQGHAPAKYRKAMQLLAEPSEEGFDEALVLLYEASNERLVSAMYVLARFKQEGIGVEQDLEGAADLYRRLTLAGHSEARPYLRAITRELERQSNNDELVASLREADNMERIQVTGQRTAGLGQLDAIVRRLDATGQFDNRSIGSRIRGVSCEQSGSNCVVTRPGDASSIDEIISGN